MKKVVFVSFLLYANIYYTQTDRDSTRVIQEVFFLKKTPFNKEILSVEKDLKTKNLGQDLPLLLKNLTSIVSTSDAGNGVGYASFRVRGTDSRSINVMLNGVPYNDSESLGSFFVDVPDLTSSASQLVLQRGVGTSSNGTASFGASLNVITKNPSEKAYISTSNSVGSFNTFKTSAEIATGALFGGKLQTFVRFSDIKSDGYLERAFSNLKSYVINSTYQSGNTTLRYINITGKEKTQQAWNGITEADYKTNPRMNYGGAIFNEDGSVTNYYDNETDNYTQSHHQLLWKQKMKNNWLLESTLHYTLGKGFYENYKQDAKLYKYNSTATDQSGQSIAKASLIRQKWLDNDFYGFVSNLYKNTENYNLHFGLVANQYFGRHYGKVIAVENAALVINPSNYYLSHSLKNEVSAFSKAIINRDQWRFFADLQIRTIDYKAHTVLDAPDETVSFDQNYEFFNPKMGLSYMLNAGKFYASFARANREPSRADLVENQNTKAEGLNDWELGFEKQEKNYQFAINFYYMSYKNQLVFSGKLNDVGAPIRENIGKSTRFGVEINQTNKINSFLNLNFNLNLSDNKNLNYDEGTPKKQFAKISKIAFSPSVIANANLEIIASKQIKLQITNQYIGRQYLDNTENSGLMLNDYFLMDFNGSYQFQLFKNQASVQFFIQNLLNRSYINNGYVYDATAYYYPQATRHFMLGFTWTIQ